MGMLQAQQIVALTTENNRLKREVAIAKQGLQKLERLEKQAMKEVSAEEIPDEESEKESGEEKIEQDVQPETELPAEEE